MSQNRFVSIYVTQKMNNVPAKDVVMRFGMYAGLTQGQVRFRHPSYCAWALRVTNPQQPLKEFVDFLLEDKRKARLHDVLMLHYALTQRDIVVHYPSQQKVLEDIGLFQPSKKMTERIFVDYLTEGGPAHSAGVTQGDCIISFEVRWMFRGKPVYVRFRPRAAHLPTFVVSLIAEFLGKPQHRVPKSALVEPDMPYGRNASSEMLSFSARAQRASSMIQKVLPTEDMPVIEEVPHSDPAAQINPHEAAEVVNEQWAQSVELLGDAMFELSQDNPAVSLATTDEDKSTNNDTSQQALPDTPECLLPDCWLLTRTGPMAVGALQVGQELLAGRAHAVVQSIHRLMSVERQIVILHCASMSLQVSASHIVIARSQQESAFRPRKACQVQRGDRLRGREREIEVVRVEPDILDTELLEVRLFDSKGSFFVGAADTSPMAYIEVCGAGAPLDGCVVEILRFQRHERFREIVRDSPALEACRAALEDAGFDVDLSLFDLGPGKLLVRATLADRVLRALREHCRSELLKASDVVVSEEFKDVLLEELRLHAPRVNHIVSCTPLTLGPKICVRRTFVEIADSSSSGATVQSSDAHLGIWGNPRKTRRH